MADNQNFFYLASPYTAYPDGQTAAVADVTDMAARLVDKGWLIYSPIIQTHNIALKLNRPSNGSLDEYRFWLGLDLPFIARSEGMIIANMDTVLASRGVRWEYEWMVSRNKPVYMASLIPVVKSMRELKQPALIQSILSVDEVRATPGWEGSAKTDPLPVDLFGIGDPRNVRELPLQAGGL